MVALAGCQSSNKIVTPPPVQAPPPSFACDTTAQEIICSSEALARLDKALAENYHRSLRRSDTFGRDQMIAEQTHWLIGRASACHVPTLRVDYAAPPNPLLISCLIRIYSERVDVLKPWPQVVPVARPGAQAIHPLSAYVEFKQAEFIEPQLCNALADAFNASIRNYGDVDIPRIPGMVEVAGSHGDALSTRKEAPGFAVDLYDAGLYAGFAMRARSVKSRDSRTLLDESSLGSWISRLPNHGGRPNSQSSQTGDYGFADVFLYSNRLLALLADPWGKYSSGAQGEWAYAGVYQIGTAGTAEPLCLFRTYMTPPLKNAFDRLSAFNSMLELLSKIHGRTSSELVGKDLHEEHQAMLERRWMLQNMPLIAVGDAKRNGWQDWLRMRNDAVFDALFAWSERSLRNKTAYRRLLALLPAVGEELFDSYQAMQGLAAEDARETADMTLMRMLAYYASDLPGAVVVMPNTSSTASATGKYQPKYSVIATAADIQRNRSFSGLYSAALNGAEKDAIEDYIKYEYAERKTRLTRGAGGETALMAAVESPEIVRQLLAAGANVNETDVQRKTALMNAAEAGQVESAGILVKAGAKISVRTRAAARPDAEVADATPSGQKACDLIKQDIRPEDRLALQGMLCSAAQEPAEREGSENRAEVPVLKVGDRWKYEVIESKTGIRKDSIDQRITSVSDSKIEGTENDGKLVMTPGLNVLESSTIRTISGEGDLLSFPLEVGKKWDVKANFKVKKGNIDMNSQLHAIVVAQERIKVPAGEFDAFKIEYNGNWRVELEGVARTIKDRMKVTIWFAPDVRNLVRTEIDNGISESVIQLVEFQAQP
jgi:uncharacterized protein YecT (DUF1311 family)